MGMGNETGTVSIHSLMTNICEYVHIPSCTHSPDFVRNLKSQLRGGQINLYIPYIFSAVVFEIVFCIVTCRVLVLVLLVFSIMPASFLDPRDM